MPRNSLLEAGAIFEVQVTATRLEPTNTHPFSQTGQMIELCCDYLSVWCIWLNVTVMSHMNFRLNPHSIVCLNVKALLAWSRCHIWSLSDSNTIWTHNHLVRKQTFNHLAKWAKWLSCVVITYQYGVFDCMLFSCHVWVSERIHTLQFAWMSGKSLLEAGTISEVSNCCHLKLLQSFVDLRTFCSIDVIVWPN